MSLVSTVRSSTGRVAPGTVRMFAGTTLPTGWLYCDGAPVSQTTYANLFAIVSFTYGNPGGGNFNLPDYRGRFIRGLDNMGPGAAGIDSGRSLGSAQGDAFVSHSHSSPSNANNSASSGNTAPPHTHFQPVQVIGAPGNQRFDINNSPNSNAQNTQNDGPAHSHPISVTTNTSVTIDNAGSPETRPTNIALKFKIKT